MVEWPGGVPSPRDDQSPHMAAPDVHDAFDIREVGRVDYCNVSLVYCEVLV